MRIVLAWELGANWGHARRLEALARVLTARGHEVHLVVQDLGAFDARSLRLWQAPVWSGLLRYSATRALGPPQRYGDLLANLGLQDAQAITGLLRGWEALIDAIRPDALVADFAPAALLASRGRLPRLATGTGFTVPPAHLDHFPPFPGATPAPLVSEASLLSLINQALEGLNRLIAAYERADQAYVSRLAPQFAQRAFSDYDHLARVREWSVADEAETEDE